MKNLTTLLSKTSSTKSLLCLFVLSHFILLFMMVKTFPIINDQIDSTVFDLQTFGYSLSEAQSIVSKLDDRTRALYLFPQLTLLDVLYPFLLALFLSSLLFRLMKISGTHNRISSFLLIIPFLAMGFDYLENVCIALMILEYVELSEMIVLVSSACTILKGVLTSISWMGILGYAIIWVRTKLRPKSALRVLERSR